ncbi:DUF2809 domain-containing protein [Clostridium paraputrificum]|uniref:ribosomal maturation YjgA family protein n=1 Tax=Clostridium TaxID=1485 RepID=UPI003D32DB35
MKRKRVLYICLIIIVMGLGILSRKYGDYMPAFLKEYSGDTLWALMVYLGFGFLLNKASIQKVSIISIVFSWGIEFSQLYQGGWINQIRDTTIGGLVLGHGFLFSDLICYAVGIIIGILIESIVYGWRKEIKYK